MSKPDVRRRLPTVHGVTPFPAADVEDGRWVYGVTASPVPTASKTATGAASTAADVRSSATCLSSFV